jgi:RHS repeat-associated protein
MMLDKQDKADEGNATSRITQPPVLKSSDEKPPSSQATISTPKGGGAIRDIGEKFTANPVTGTGSLNIPIVVSPGRANFSPQLALTYDSGAGNGPFGIGWNLSIPVITRKTDKGLPQYQDAVESDTFILSGAEDLVPQLNKNQQGIWQHDKFERGGYIIHRYRPRIEGLFARIECWTRKSDNDTYWRSISKDNITTVYGRSARSRIVDPADSSHVFSWLICESYDDKGNAIYYDYKPEDNVKIDVSLPQEQHRFTANQFAQLYLKCIRYGNRTPRAANEDLGQRVDWMFEVVLDYNDHNQDSPNPNPDRDWPVRSDPFSTFRAGFDVRTYRLCHRILLFHHFPAELQTANYLVRSTDFTYRSEVNSSLSQIIKIEEKGYTRQQDSTYYAKSFPPLEFEYTEPHIDPTIREVDSISLENLPAGLDSSHYQWVDLDGEGLSGILTEQANAWFYKRNISSLPVQEDGEAKKVEARFAPTELVRTKPSIANLSGGQQQFLDLAGDGSLDLVQFGAPSPGFYDRTDEAGWEQFVPFKVLPNVNWTDPNLKFIDLTGDGHADILITEAEVFTWYQALGTDGYAYCERVMLPYDEESGPYLIFADGSASIYLADMSGDGLVDIVRIRNGEVCYWANLGYGRFSPKIMMDNAPWFDSSDQFDQRRIRLADIDGSGTTDLIYLAADGVHLYFNRAGNGWTDDTPLAQFPAVDNSSQIQTIDLLGNGTSCLVWSSPLPGNANHPMRYIDLMGGQKPHLLISSKNNMGAETHVHYAPSTKFYLRDRQEGNAWITRLPFPVQVVECVQTYDSVSQNSFTTRYCYHHGYFDGVEREFRGFAMVEQLDTEEIGTALPDDSPNATNVDESSYVPPIVTKTWFHVGAYFEDNKIETYFQDNAYYNADLQAYILPETVLPIDLSADEDREAARALKGNMLRQEIYALDGTVKSQHPYIVTEYNYEVKTLQPRSDDRYAVFFTHARETLTYHYERIPHDPRIMHQLALEVNDFGDVTKAASIAYGRRNPDLTLSPENQTKQSVVLVTYTETDYTIEIQTDDDYRIPIVAESRNYEVAGPIFAGSTPISFNAILGAVTGAVPIGYDVQPDGTLQKRLIEQIRTLYRKNDLSAPLPAGQLESMALPFESYKLAYSPGLATKVFGNRVTDAMFIEGGYVHSQGDQTWWIPTGQVFYSPTLSDTTLQEQTFASAHFFLPHRFSDPFSNNTIANYDANILLLTSTLDAVGNTTTAHHDYRVLQPDLVTDPNGNRTAISFDSLGMITGTALMGKITEAVGDSLNAFVADLSDVEISSFLANPLAEAAQLLKNATSRIVYDLNAQPAFAATISRETHVSDLSQGVESKLQISFSYSDGFGREFQRKIQAKPGDVDGVAANPRWIGSGWTVFNNKGKPIKKYEPFFSTTHQFEKKTNGVTSILFYDPVERVVATMHPDHTYEKVVFDAWRQTTWDVNDTVTLDPRSDDDVKGFFLHPDGTPRLPTDDYLPTWYGLRTDPANAAVASQKWPSLKKRNAEMDAATKAAVHANTPTIAYFDSLGRTFVTIAQNKFTHKKSDGSTETLEEKYSTVLHLDIKGNQRAVIDPRGRTVMQYDYDIPGNRVRQGSMEAGTRWSLNDIVGKPIYAWNSRGYIIRTIYDGLRRPTDVFLTDGTGSTLLVQSSIYGESQPNPEIANLRTKLYQVSDGAGVVKTDLYDFKGNLLRTARNLAVNYKDTLDWSAVVALEPDIYTSSTDYDALNRPVTLQTPDNSMLQLSYNEGNLLDRITGNIRGAAVVTPFVNGIDYNEKGQRERIQYGNGVTTTYGYERETFRLSSLFSTRGAAFPNDGTDPTQPPSGVQNLTYTYDPIGNITNIRDDAQQTIYFRNRQVEPSSDYTYDAIYRLISAAGREHLGQNADGSLAPSPSSPTDVPHVNLLHPGDGNAMGRYVQQYSYDEVGNILKMIHQGSDPANPGWTLNYHYDEPSLLEATQTSNRLSSTQIGDNPLQGYTYDAHGNMTTMPHLPLMQWDYRDMLQATAQQHVNAGTPEITYYTYDTSGQRVRKITVRGAAEGQAPTRKMERIYLGGLEIYREYDANGTRTLERQDLHIMDDKRRVALVETRTQGNDAAPQQLIRYQLSNHLGSACLELDDQAQIISYEEYYPYGSTSYQAVRSQTETPKRYRYTGKERDEESGLYYYGARYYAAWLGRWINCDSAGMIDGVNLYYYTKNNPVILLDSQGFQAVQPEITQANTNENKAEGANANQPENPQNLLQEIRDLKAQNPEIFNPHLSKEILDATNKLTNNVSNLVDENRFDPRKIEIIEKPMDIILNPTPPPPGGTFTTDKPLSDTEIDEVKDALKTAINPKYIVYEGEIRVGGTLAWRANNPGNLRESSAKIALTAVSPKNKFAVFATLEAGREAQKNLYLNKFGNKTVRDAVTGKVDEKGVVKQPGLTPPSDKNDTKGYLKQLEAQGVDLDKTVKSQIDTLMTAVKKNEGMKPGVIIQRR